jgi:hypothetical protein
MTGQGFQPTPHISQGEAQRLEKICDRVLSGEPDADRSLHSWVERITRKLGSEKAWGDWFVHHANDDLGYAIASKFHEAMLQVMPTEIRQKLMDKSKECLTSMLQDDGLVLGKDFSMAPDGGFILGEAAIEKLKADMPHQAWADWESQDLIKSVTSCPWEAVEKRLEVCFRQNLMTRLSQLVMQGRSAAVIAGWLLTISCGVSNQIMGTDEDLTLFGWMLAHLKENHPAVYEVVLTAIKSEQLVDGDELLEMDINPMADVAIAAGSSEENGEIQGDRINRKCLERLSLVWRGDRLSVPEVIGLYDKATTK